MTTHYPESWRDALRAIGRAPGAGWRSRLVHHGSRALLLLALALAVPLLFPGAPLPDFARLEQGQVATEDIIADLSFDVPKSPERLQAERAEAERGVAPIFTYDREAVDRATQRVRQMFARLDSALAVADDDTAAARIVLADLENVTVPTLEQATYLRVGSRRRLLRDALLRAYDRLLPIGVVSSRDLSDVLSAQVIVRQDGGDRLVRRDSLLDVAGFYARASEIAPSSLAVEGLQLYQTLVVHYLEESLRLDLEATARARQQARNAVQESAGFVLEGERIVGAHERVGREEIEKLRAYSAALTDAGLAGRAGSFLHSLGGLLYAMVVIAILWAVLYFYRRAPVYESARSFAIVVLLPLVVLLLASVVARASAPPALIPVALAGLLVAALFDGLLAIVSVMVIAALLAGQTAFPGLSAAFLTMAAGTAAAAAIRILRRRADSWKVIAIITAAYFLASLALGLLFSWSARELVAATAFGALSATVCTVLVVGGLLPALETFTGVTTRQTLLELSDLNRPLLRQLAKKAPGTYAHSIGVANLAEAACTAIGANALLARVGTYYHDIGKTKQPQYFVENQPGGRNPHDRLRPSRSAEVIKEHVREGLRLADEARLPSAIKDFITEHHGTLTISYFLNKAREQEPDVDIDLWEYSYPGPKPQSRETAVVMLADCVESATRTLPDPTPERIRSLIDQLVGARIRDGQLDQSPLTLDDIHRIKAEFAQTLTSFYHQRVEYPSVANRQSPPPGAERRSVAGGSAGGGARAGISRSSGTGARAE
ncbi:MAG: HDIG domain-containing protein [Gemmatimonadota bacterium]|nr:MAG: HDIG domain-containing protein [Gemmatimonadota bacterium]